MTVVEQIYTNFKYVLLLPNFVGNLFLRNGTTELPSPVKTVQYRMNLMQLYIEDLKIKDAMK